MADQANVTVEKLLVGGGVSASDLACQIQADLLGMTVERPSFAETTAWAAALLAGLGAGFWAAPAEMPPLPGTVTSFEPDVAGEKWDAGYGRFKMAVQLARKWGEVA